MYKVSCYYEPLTQIAHLVCCREGTVIHKQTSKSGQQIRQPHRAILIEKIKRERLTAHEISQKSLNELFDFCLLISEIFKHLYLIEIYFKKFN